MTRHVCVGHSNHATHWRARSDRWGDRVRAVAGSDDALGAGPRLDELRVLLGPRRVLGRFEERDVMRGGMVLVKQGGVEGSEGRLARERRERELGEEGHRITKEVLRELWFG
ncbi:hypothetical protein HK101_000482 [Irineochytrium annulatum]|nr:hypothetical protein HK101_000482 [Irineochytrium annulatum]